MQRRILAYACIPALLALGACNGNGGSGGNGGTPVVTVAGAFALLVGEVSQLTAATVNGTDADYTWTCDNDAVASVTPGGLVTAKAAGTAYITARGTTTGTAGRMGIVVAEKPAEVPYYVAWQQSGHADKTSYAFNRWNADGQISTSCAKCHSTPGFRDFLGDDGSPAGVVDAPAPLGTTVECNACHNPTAEVVNSVTFPSGVQIADLGREARCMQCHQGRQSTDSVDQAITDAAAATDDTVSPALSFRNIHYFPAAATRYGGEARGGYQYAGKTYDIYFDHVPGYTSCTDCHDAHTTRVKVSTCAQCHDVATEADLKGIRMQPSMVVDYDGDGDRTEGMYHEIAGLKSLLMTAIQAYARDLLGDPIVYDKSSHPYFYRDTNGNGIADAGEVTSANRYASWTPRLIRATYNYQFASKDPGGYAHNAKYIIQLLSDSMADLNTVLPVPMDLSKAVRNDPGHFDGSDRPARRWDGGTVSASCAKCHTGSTGLSEFLTYGVNTAQQPNNGTDCATCHTTFDTFETRRILQATFPGGKLTPSLPGTTPTDDPRVQSNLCVTCHGGRNSMKTIDDAIAAGTRSFQNVHYYPAAGVVFGNDGQVGYQFPGKVYASKFAHFGTGSTSNNCTYCHDAGKTKHSFKVEDNLATCQQCHTVTDVRDIRLAKVLDYDGDGNTAERLSDEIATLQKALAARIYEVTKTPGPGMVYDGSAHPYWYKDTNGNGVADPAEVISSNRFTAFTPDLMKVTHNYQLSKKDPGSWAHHFAYTAQLLIDSIEVLGGDISPYRRP